jgi:hypothetical protein
MTYDVTAGIVNDVSNFVERISGEFKSNLLKEVINTVNDINNLPFTPISLSLDRLLDTYTDIMYTEDVTDNDTVVMIFRETVIYINNLLYQIGITLNKDDINIIGIKEILVALYNTYNADESLVGYIIEKLSLDDVDNEERLIDVFVMYGTSTESVYRSLIFDVDDELLSNIIEYATYKKDNSIADIEDDKDDNTASIS